MRWRAKAGEIKIRERRAATTQWHALDYYLIIIIFFLLHKPIFTSPACRLWITFCACVWIRLRIIRGKFHRVFFFSFCLKWTKNEIIKIREKLKFFDILFFRKKIVSNFVHNASTFVSYAQYVGSGGGMSASGDTIADYERKKITDITCSGCFNGDVKNSTFLKFSFSKTVSILLRVVINILSVIKAMKSTN